MKHEDIQSLSGNFESFVHQLENGLEFWFARDLQHLLGYTEWRKFSNTISKAKTAVEISGEEIANYFVGINKTIQMPKGASKEIQDTMLTRYAGSFTYSKKHYQSREKTQIEDFYLEFKRIKLTNCA